MLKNLFTRDRTHFFLMAWALVFGLVTAIPGLSAPPAGSGVLFWWSTPYTVSWVVLLVSLFVLIIAVRVLAFRFPVFPAIAVIVGGVITGVAVWLASQCHLAIYPDRIERHTLTFKGFNTQIMHISDVDRVHLDCDIDKTRGAISTNAIYRLTFGDGDTLNMTEGRNDGRDGGGWIRAIDAIDTQLMNRGLIRQKVDYDQSPESIAQCVALLAKDRPPEDQAVINRAFTPVNR